MEWCLWESSSPQVRVRDPRFMCLPEFSPEPRDAPSLSPDPSSVSYRSLTRLHDQSGAWLMTVNRDLSPGQADESQRNFSRTRDSI